MLSVSVSLSLCLSLCLSFSLSFSLSLSLSLSDPLFGPDSLIFTLRISSPSANLKAAIPSLKASKAGRIINIASISGRTVHATSSPAYGAAKAGVIQLTRFLAWELGPHNITANSIAPITTLTPRVAALRTPEQVEQMAASIPLRRLAEPIDHVNAMLWLASDAASYINGVSLDVNGGRVMF